MLNKIEDIWKERSGTMLPAMECDDRKNRDLPELQTDEAFDPDAEAQLDAELDEELNEESKYYDNEESSDYYTDRKSVV